MIFPNISSNFTNITESVNENHFNDISNKELLVFAMEFGIFPSVLFIGLLINILTLITFIREKEKSSTVCLMIAMNTADITVIISRAIVLILMYKNIQNPILFIVVYYANLCTRCFTISLAAERLYAISNPFSYKIKSTPLFGIKIIVLVCFTALIFISIETINNIFRFVDKDFYVIGIMAFTIITVCVLNIITIVKIKGKTVNIESDEERKKWISKNRRIAVSIIFMCLLYISCFGSIVIFLVGMRFFNLHALCGILACCLNLCYSGFNSLLFMLINTYYRKKFTNTICYRRS